ncbi:hypothetical protein ACEQ8H_002533 [Pleosporales sp. CAS-2024a]
MLQGQGPLFLDDNAIPFDDIGHPNSSSASSPHVFQMPALDSPWDSLKPSKEEHRPQIIPDASTSDGEEPSAPTSCQSDRPQLSRLFSASPSPQSYHQGSADNGAGRLPTTTQQVDWSERSNIREHIPGSV